MTNIFDNGGLIGKTNNTSISVASGMWNLNAQYDAKANNLWPTTVITSGLTLWLDSAESSSYPGTGSTWYDISGNNNNMTLFNNPTFSNNVLQFNGTNQYGTITGLNYSATTFTIMGISRYSGTTRGRVITSVTNNWLLGHWSSGSERYFAEGWVYNSGTVNDTNWRIYAATENYTTDQRTFYVNNAVLANNSSAGSAGFNGLSIGRWAAGSEYSTCEVAVILIYNRLLSSSELTQNYNFYKTRFGL